MGIVTMNIQSAVWDAPGGVTFDEEALVNFDFGGDIVEHSAGTDTHINDSQVVNIRGLYTIGFNDRATFLSLSSKISIEAKMTIKIKDMDNVNGVQLAVVLSRLQRVTMNAQQNAPTAFSAAFYSRSTDGTTSPLSVSTF